jgi:hypothetical protein
MIRKPAVLAVLVLAGLASAAQAQTRGQPLKDIAKVNIVVEDIIGNGDVCGVRRPDLQSAFANKLAGSPLQVVTADAAKDDPEVVVLYIKGSVMPIEIPGVQAGPCVSHVSVKLFDYQKLTLVASHRETFGSVELWDKGLMLSTSREVHGKAIYDGVAEKAADLITSWRLDNPGK